MCTMVSEQGPGIGWMFARRRDTGCRPKRERTVADAPSSTRLNIARATPNAVVVVSMIGLGAAELLPLSRPVGGCALRTKEQQSAEEL